MVAIIQNMVFKLRFLCTPMPLESFEAFKERTQEISDDEIEQELQKLANGVIGIMAQKDAIPSALTPSLMEAMNNSYIRHISPLIGFFGCDKKRMEWKTYEEAYMKYSDEVEEALSVKAASVVEEGSNEHSQLKEINDHLVIKWTWLKNGIFDGETWSASTSIPLLTQTVIKHFDLIVEQVISAFEEVSKSKPVYIYVA